MLVPPVFQGMRDKLRGPNQNYHQHASPLRLQRRNSLSNCLKRRFCISGRPLECLFGDLEWMTNAMLPYRHCWPAASKWMDITIFQTAYVQWITPDACHSYLEGVGTKDASAMTTVITPPSSTNRARPVRQAELVEAGLSVRTRRRAASWEHLPV